MAADDRLRPLFHPRSVAVVGASPRGGYGLTTLQNLREIGFSGAIYPINPNYSEIAGLPTYPSLFDLPETPDVVAIAVPAAASIEVVRQASEAGVMAGVVYAAGFAEAGEAGAALQRELAQACRAADFAAVGPNCLGVVGYAEKSAIWGITMGRPHPGGHVAMVSQSGNIGLNLMMSRRGLRLSHAVSCGNSAVLDVTDFMERFLQEPTVRVITAVLEWLGDIRRFGAIAECARERDIPIVVLKIGRTEKGRRAAEAHTGMLTGADDLYDALFRRHGIIRCDDVEELVETARLLAADRRPKGRRIGVFASSGGECGLVSDLAAEIGLELPDVPEDVADAIQPYVPTPVVAANPLDITAMGWAQREVYRLATQSLAALPAVDAVISIGDAATGAPPLPELGWVPMARGLGDGVRVTDKPVLNITTLSEVREDLLEAFEKEGVIPLIGLRPGLRAVALAAAWAEHCKPSDPRPLLDPAGTDRRGSQARSLLKSGRLSESEGKALLTLYGIPVPEGAVAQTPLEAGELAERLGYPVAIKVQVPGIGHKSDIGGVALHLHSRDDVYQQTEAMQRRVMDRLGLGELPPVLVEPMASGVAELIVGGGNDPLFGPFVMAGTGGVIAEAAADVAHALAPVSVNEARDLLHALRFRAVLEGFRGRPPADLDAVAEIIARASELLTELPEIAELDINPLIAGPEGYGAVAVDALVITRDATTAEGAKL